MKKRIISLLMGIILLSSSCQDYMDKKHENSDAFTKTKIEYLFAQGILKTIEMDYSDCYSYNFRLLSTYMQTAARREGKDRINVYEVKDDKTRWNNYYITRMSLLTEIENIYTTLNSAGQEEYRPYIEAGKILKAFNTSIATDFFGNMPYSEAFTARNPLYGGSVNFKPKYDDQKDIYYAILNDLKAASDYFKSASLNETEAQAAFPRQDILYKGNLTNWYKFANSLRLRYAMRISNVDPEKAKKVLSEITLTDLITTNQDNAVLLVDGSIYNFADKAIWRALKESHNKTNGYYAYAPELMTTTMKAANDPRMQVLFQPASDDEGKAYNNNQEIIPYPSSADAAIALLNGTTADKILHTYALYNTTTIRKNSKFPVGIAMTAAETYLCLAEAAARNLITGNAEEFYNRSIILSVQNYYNYYVQSDSKETKVEAIANTDVSDATLLAWINSSSYRYSASRILEQIATQKWMHLNILQPYENWAEYRRTDLPVLLDDKEKGALLNKENMPVRFLYPSTEASMNTENYNQQSENNKTDAHLWWDIK
ncbi:MULTISPECIES: SusD/RagB family nutrient-binding outer membrane lipoprotein [Bacteroides]|uniref:SusD/RagB family nutrient-binding outer membrane lipoprotein n=1 Tax=Bacteroides TaxID=816 RepID=UPI0005A6F34B|nr:SusD/RagB family nutrient-binding outer membrane lipoprotein [Bacteroides neonati]